MELRLHVLDVLDAALPAGRDVNQQLAGGSGHPAGNEVAATGGLVGRDHHGGHAAAADPLVEGPVISQAHALGQALDRQVENVAGVLLAQLQGVAQGVRLNGLPASAVHWNDPPRGSAKQKRRLLLGKTVSISTMESGTFTDRHIAMTDRIEELNARVNALAQAWLYLAATLEKSGLVDHQQLDQALRDASWTDSAIDDEGRRTLGWLADQLDGAHLARQLRMQPA
ncbi:hypothetical protein FQZ97_498000 [compost metagenome]